MHPTSEHRQRRIENGRKTKPFDPFAFALRRGALVVALGGALSFVFHALTLPMVRPVYETDAQLMVDPTKEPTLSGRERDLIPGTVGDYMRTLASRISDYDVLQEAIRRLPPDRRPVFMDEASGMDRNIYRLMSRMRVVELPRTYLIGLSLGGTEAAGLSETLNAVLEVFIEKIGVEQERLHAGRLAYLRAERDRVCAQIEEARARMLAMAETAGSNAFLHEASTVHLSKVEQIQRLFWEAESTRADKAGLLQKALSDRETIGAMDLQPFADERVADNFGINRIEQWTYEQLQVMRAGIDGLTPENPDRQYVETRMAAMNEYLVGYKQRMNQETIRNLREKSTYELDAEVARARSALAAAADTAETLGRQLETARAEASMISEAIFQSGTSAFAVSHLRERLAAIESRMDESEMEAKAPLRISIAKRAATPGRPAHTNRKQLFLLALALGFGGVLAAALGFDLLDNRLRSIRDVEHALGAPGPDPVASFVSGLAPAPRFAHILRDLPDHPAARAIRELAVRLNTERERHGGRIFAFCDVTPGCGATAIALQTAEALSAWCPDVLVIETQVRRPGLRTATDGPAGPGLETALRGTRPWTDLVRTDDARGLRLLPAEGGERPSSLRALADLLQEARSTHAAVIVDAGDVLTDDLAYHAAIHADAAILIAREDATLYRDLRRAIDLLSQAGVPALTAVLNHARPPWADRMTDHVQRELGRVSRLHRRAMDALRSFLSRGKAAA